MPDAAAPQNDYQSVLDGFVTQGAAIAAAIAACAKQAAPAQLPSLASAFDRVTRGVRRTILLIDHRARAATAAGQARIAARKRIYRDVTDAIAAECLATKRPDPERAEALRVELVERLESFDLGPDLDIEITRRRIEEIIHEIRRDLGLANQPGMPKWPRRTPDDVADILALARAVPQPPPRLAEN